MPYAPGIQDISGQLLAQGMQQRAQGIAGGITDWVKGYDQNQALKRQALSQFAGATAADPEILKFLTAAQQGQSQGDPNAPKVPPEVLKAFTNVQKGDVDLYDASILGNFATTYQNTKNESTKRNLMEQQTALAKQQVAGEAQKLAQQQQAAEYFKNLMQTPEQSQVPAGVLSAAGAAGVSAQGSMVSDAGAPTRRQAAAQLFQESGGRIPSDPQVTQAWAKNMAEWRKQQLESKEYTSFDEAARGVKEAQSAGLIPTGTAPTIKKNNATGGWYFETVPSSIESAAASSERAGLEAGAKEKAQSAVRYLDQVSADAREATNDLYRIRRAQDLLQKGVPTGPLTPEALQLKAAAVQLGLLDEKQAEAVKDGQELMSRLGEGALRGTQRYLKGGGSVSNAERDRVDAVAENARKSPGANLELLKTMEAVHMKDIAANEYRLQLENDGRLNDTQVRRAVEKWVNSPENSIDRFMGRSPAQPGVKELTVSTSGMGETKVVPQFNSPAQPKYVSGGTYRGRDGKLYVWDGSKMVPKQ